MIATAVAPTSSPQRIHPAASLLVQVLLRGLARVTHRFASLWRRCECRRRARLESGRSSWHHSCDDGKRSDSTEDQAMTSRHPWVFACALAAGSALTLPAAAQQRSDTVEYVGPNRPLLKSGAWTLGLSYVPALIVGIESDLPEDRYLLVPVAGPWVDLAKRDCPTCEHETMNKVLLAADGIFQGIGSLQIIGSFLFFERTETTVVSRRKPSDGQKSDFSLRLSPKRYSGGGFGLNAIGTF